MSNPFAPPTDTSAPDGRPPRRRGLVVPFVAAGLLVLGGIGAGVWAVGAALQGAFAADGPLFDVADPPSVDDGLDDPWRRGDLVQGVDGGTFQDPWPIEGPVATSQWTVEMSDPHLATDEILAADPGNTPPYETNEFWMVRVEATYTGPDRELTASTSLDVNFLSDEGTFYSMTCGVVPDELDATGLLTTGTTVTGNVCIALPAQTPGSWHLSNKTSGFVFLRAP